MRALTAPLVPIFSNIKIECQFLGFTPAAGIVKEHFIYKYGFRILFYLNENFFYHIPYMFRSYLSDIGMTADALFGDADDISSGSDDEAPKVARDDDDVDDVRRGEDEDAEKVRTMDLSLVLFEIPLIIFCFFHHILDENNWRGVIVISRSFSKTQRMRTKNKSPKKFLKQG